MTTHERHDGDDDAAHGSPVQPTAASRDAIAADAGAGSDGDGAAERNASSAQTDALPPSLPPVPASSVAMADSSGWLPLPMRARWLYIISTAVGVSLVALAVAILLALAGIGAHRWLMVPAAMLLGAMLGALYGNRRYVNTRWRHDGDGFALRRGRLWQSDTRVPGSRVQHLDLKRGPVERLCGLATLVVHTAGTRHSAVALSGLDHADAERLRDALSRQTDDDDDG